MNGAKDLVISYFERSNVSVIGLMISSFIWMFVGNSLKLYEGILAFGIFLLIDIITYKVFTVDRNMKEKLEKKNEEMLFG